MMELWLKMLMSSGDLLTQDICRYCIWYNYYLLVIINYFVRLAACLEFYNLNENLNEKFSALD